MNRAVLALALLVTLTTALQIADALHSGEMSTLACGLCHDATVVTAFQFGKEN
jgi:hypothetical protein